MLQGYRVFDADAHGSINPSMWENLPEKFRPRRPRPVTVHDDSGLANFNAGWLIEGSLEPHALGPGSQQANTPRNVLREFGADVKRDHCSIGSMTLNDPQARLADMDRMGFDAQMLFPSTLYAHMTNDPEFEAALFRAYNRFVAKKCEANPQRLKWSGLLPLRDQRQALQAISEMTSLGARAAVVFGTAGDRLLSDPSILPIWDEFTRAKLPLCVHMGMSYPPLAQLGRSIFDGHIIGMSLPAQLAFMAIVGHGMLDRYQDLNVAFLEFGAEWIFYMVSRMDHYLPLDRGAHPFGLSMPNAAELPRASIRDYAKSGRIFIAAEADDRMLHPLFELVGEDQVLFSSDFPHGEGRDNAALEIIERQDLSREQKQKL
ncbi:MAG TPA: amidohydrolase family protein, partial [Candidatus Limnocylindrales bacterium]|nr:amidohydrolase family protein [Candidatus Limnocylindrales bacterium]